MLVCALLVALAGCSGGDDDKEPASSDGKSKPAGGAVKPAPLHNGVFQANDVADCLLDAGVGAAVSLSGARIDLHDASAQVIVEQGDGDILIYGSSDRAAAQEAEYRKSFPGSSEVRRVRNVLFEADPDLASGDKSKVEDCLGV
jgi:hypothetical protein